MVKRRPEELNGPKPYEPRVKGKINIKKRDWKLQKKRDWRLYEAKRKPRKKKYIPVAQRKLMEMQRQLLFNVPQEIME